ncbi:glycosyltransferase family 4 protein [Carnobacterium gallinarum]|uniref:glycosyltransferase family 4 protein n=1 Tax=Carnobacterium gallinarum TaxID=2749 RepID=UPI000555137C|nr:glycosyltransferase family 4 protein [Carnobacterium gallinarum]
MNIYVLRNSVAKTSADIKRIAESLYFMGYNVTIISRLRGEKTTENISENKYRIGEDYILNKELNVKSNENSGLKNLFNLMFYMFKLLNILIKDRKQYEVIHAFDLDTGLPALVMSIFFKKKYVYHILDFYVDSKSGIPRTLKKIIKKMEFLVISKADCTIICTNERMAQIDGSKPKKIEIIYNTPVKNKFIEVEKNSYIANTSRTSICYVGTLSKTRFIDEMLEIVSKNDKLLLTIAGNGTSIDKVNKYSKEFSNIAFLGTIDYEKSLELYSESDLMFAIYDPTIPNHKYSAPNKIYEAMMLGKPIIVAKDTGMDDIILKEKIGFSVDYSINEIATLLEFISDNKEILKEYKINSSNAYPKYSWDKMEQRLKNIYYNLY